VIYLDSSAALAHLFNEDRIPPTAMWLQRLYSSRLLQYELWNRIHVRGFTHSHADETRALLARVTLIDLSPPVLMRALEPFPISVRTIDGLHLATIAFLRARGESVELASYDRRLVAAARALDIAIYSL
jgi:hypothetical protein